MNLLIKKGMLVALIFAVFLFTDCVNASSPESDTLELTPYNSKVIELTKADFLTKVMNIETAPNERVYLGAKPCIVLFYVWWETPCKLLMETFSRLSGPYYDKVIFYQVNIEKEKELFDVFGYQCYPIMMFYPVGEEPIAVIGNRSDKELKIAIYNTFGIELSPFNH